MKKTGQGLGMLGKGHRAVGCRHDAFSLAAFQEYFRVTNKESSVRFRKKGVTGSFLLGFTSFIYIAFFKKMFNTVQMKP